MNLRTLNRSSATYLSVVAIIWSQVAQATPEWSKVDWWAKVASIRAATCEAKLAGLAQGEPVYRDQGTSFTLDDYTWKDIGVEKLIFPALARHSQGLLGQLRIAGMLRKTSLDSKEILLRQQAIKELQSNPRLRAALNALFKVMSEHVNQDKLTTFSLNGSTELSRGMELAGAALTHLSWLAPLMIAATSSPREGAAALLSSVMFLGLGTKASKDLVELRLDHSRIKRAIELTHVLMGHLQSSTSPLLREIAATLSQFDKAGTSPESETTRKYLQLNNGPLASFLLDRSYVSSITLRAMNRTFELHKSNIVRLLSALSELEALTALTEFSLAPGRTFPTILGESLPTQLRIRNGHHPFVLEDVGDSSIANDAALSAAPGSDTKFTILTGINTGGKSTYLRMLASLVLIAQTGAAVPADDMALTPMAIFTNMNVNDSVEERSSFFRAQVARVADIFTELSNKKHALVLMDEILTGTSPEEHAQAEQSVVEYLVPKPAIAVLATHNRALTQMAQEFPGIRNFHVGDLDEPRYHVLPGVSRTRNAGKVMRDNRMPAEFLNIFERRSRGARP